MIVIDRRQISKSRTGHWESCEIDNVRYDTPIILRSPSQTGAGLAGGETPNCRLEILSGNDHPVPGELSLLGRAQCFSPFNGILTLCLG